MGLYRTIVVQPWHIEGTIGKFFPALPSEYETLSVNNWKYAKEVKR